MSKKTDYALCNNYSSLSPFCSLILDGYKRCGGGYFPIEQKCMYCPMLDKTTTLVNEKDETALSNCSSCANFKKKITVLPCPFCGAVPFEHPLNPLTELLIDHEPKCAIGSTYRCLIKDVGAWNRRVK